GPADLRQRLAEQRSLWDLSTSAEHCPRVLHRQGSSGGREVLLEEFNCGLPLGQTPTKPAAAQYCLMGFEPFVGRDSRWRMRFSARVITTFVVNRMMAKSSGSRRC